MILPCKLNQLCLSVSCASLLALGGCSTFPSLLSGSGEPELGNALAERKVDPDDSVGRHIYAATGVGASWMQPDTSEIPAFAVNDRVEAGGQITLGADLSRQLSLEVHSADLGSAGLSPGGRINYHVHGASALVYAGKNRHKFKRRGLTGYGRFGVGYLENTPVGDVPMVRDNSTHFLIGAGVEYMTGIGLGLRAEGISFEEDARYAQLGVIYRTGRKPEREPVRLVKAPAPAPEPLPAPVIAAAQAEPAPEPYNPCEQFDGVLDGVQFQSDSDKLTASAASILEGVAMTLAECSSVPVSIAAHTDSLGSAEYNQQLSLRRAASVVQYLSDRGIESSRLQAQAFGETQPIDTNKTAEGRSRNRRVELIAR